MALGTTSGRWLVSLPGMCGCEYGEVCSSHREEVEREVEAQAAFIAELAQLCRDLTVKQLKQEA